MNILAFDVSSKCIGFCLLDTERPAASAVLHTSAWYLFDALPHRCHTAHASLLVLLEAFRKRRYAIDQVVIEEPVIVNVKTATMQIRVSGALYAACGLACLPVQDIAPTSAKKRLTGSGKADKPAMIMAAAPYLSPGITPVVQRHAGRFWAYVNGQRAYSEDQADALGLALAAGDRVAAQVAA